MLIERLPHYGQLIRFDKPIGTWLLLWPSLWGLWIAAHGQPHALVLGIFVVGVFLMRSAGCAFNDFADRNFDGHVSRTQQRPIANGTISPTEALLISFGFMLFAFCLSLLLNPLTIKLALVGFALTLIYPWMKRFIHAPQAVLGIAFSWSIPMAFAAELNTIPIEAWVLFLIAVLWPIIYDTFYAMADREDDLHLGLKSTAIWFGDSDKLVLALLQGIFFVALICFGMWQQFNRWYFVGITTAIGFAIYQQILIKDRQPTQCFKAFLNNHWIGMWIFFGIFLNYLPPR